MRYISVRHGTVKHSGEILRSQENVMWVEEYLQSDEWKVRGEGGRTGSVNAFNYFIYFKFRSFSEAGTQVVRLA